MFLIGYFFNRYKKFEPSFEPVVPEKRYLRVNTLKGTAESLKQQLHRHGISLKETPLPNCYEYEAAFSVSTTTEHLSGKFYLQGLASQSVTHVLAPKKNCLVIDMAAAPGSKATHIAQEMKNTGRVLALDKNSERLLALRSNTERLGIANVISVRKDARFATDLNIKADAVLLDAPCSGNYCSEENWEDKRMLEDIQKNARVQKELIKAAANLLKPGGILVYSTCSLEPEENELVVEYALTLGLSVQETGLSNLGQSPGLTQVGSKKLNPSIAKCARFWPHKTGTEGFFIARLKKA